MITAQLYFNPVPDAFKDTLGAAFQTDDLNDFLYEYSDALQGAFIQGNSLFYVNGEDIEGMATWARADVLVIAVSEGGEL